jgi:hypothetical protein
VKLNIDFATLAIGAHAAPAPRVIEPAGMDLSLDENAE